MNVNLVHMEVGRGWSWDCDKARREHCEEKCKFFCVFDLNRYEIKQLRMQFFFCGGVPPDPLACLVANSQPLPEPPPPLKVSRSTPILHALCVLNTLPLNQHLLTQFEG